MSIGIENGWDGSPHLFIRTASKGRLSVWFHKTEGTVLFWDLLWRRDRSDRMGAGDGYADAAR